MQEMHSMGGGRMFDGGGGGGGGIDRRLRAHNHQSQALKCPRCDSLNTKFCYYNNYNLSQPRHFCKSCRRYWTKGGVLRNVPVGGGCRKSTKRSSKPKVPPKDDEEKRKSNSHSSSDSSSLTTTKTASTDAVSNSKNMFSLLESKFLFSSQNNPNSNSPTFENQLNGPVFPPEMGSFTSMMTACNDPMGIYNSALQNQENLQFQPANEQWQFTKEEMTTATAAAGYSDQTVQVELQSHRSSNGGFTPFDWQQSVAEGDQGFFDLPETVDHTGYWTQSQWTDNNDTPNLYLP